MSKIIAVAVPKGGIGKTTSVINIASCFAIAERKTLIIDFDPSGSCMISLGMNGSEIKGSIFDVFNFRKRFEDVIHKTELEHLDFIPFYIQSFQNEQRLEKLSTHELLLNNILQSETKKYDFTFIDCPPYLTGLTNIALSLADSVLIPVKADNYSIIALSKILNHIQFVRQKYNPKLKIDGIFLTMFESRTSIANEVLKFLQNHYPDYLLTTTIPKNVTISEATFKGRPAVLHNAISQGSQAYLSLATELLQKYEHQTRMTDVVTV
jgi:chromosome partitioning protein